MAPRKPPKRTSPERRTHSRTGTVSTRVEVPRGPRRQRKAAGAESDSPLFRLVLENINSGILVLDHAGRICLANPRAHEMLGLDEQAPGRTLPEVAPRTAEAFLGPMPGPRRQLSIEKPDGTELHLGYGLVPVDLPQGRGRIVIFRDIGPLLTADARRRRAERLAQVGETAAKLVHDLKNPLAGVLSGLRILERDNGLPEHLRPLLARTASQVHELSALASQFLDQARPPRPVPRLLSAQQLLRDALAPMELVASGHQVGLELMLPSRPIELALDPSGFRRVLTNLVLNAIQASPPGGHVWIELAPLSPEEIERRLPHFPGEVASIRVRDQGTGVPPSARAHIFEPFHTARAGGTGLGLPIALEIVEAHGGILMLRNDEGPGATFEILLPSGPRPRCVDSVSCEDCARCTEPSAYASYCCWTAPPELAAAHRCRPDRCLECTYYLRYNLGPYLRPRTVALP